MNGTFKRSEMKYLINNDQKISFMNTIANYIQNDAFSKYTICNVYFDTPDARLVRRSIEKPVYKEKMRVRSYGKADENSKVFIELKKKYDGIVYKRRISMSMDEADKYISGESTRTGQIESEIDYFIELYKGISPAMYIAYDRQAFFVSNNPDIRITFDDNIVWRDSDMSLSSDVYGNRILEKDQFVMEIKCAEVMPLWLVRALTEHKIFRSSFSKYGHAYLKKTA